MPKPPQRNGTDAQATSEADSAEEPPETTQDDGTTTTTGTM